LRAKFKFLRQIRFVQERRGNPIPTELPIFTISVFEALRRHRSYLERPRQSPAGHSEDTRWLPARDRGEVIVDYVLGIGHPDLVAICRAFGAEQA
jgi:hypothetical protein